MSHCKLCLKSQIILADITLSDVYIRNHPMVLVSFHRSSIGHFYRTMAQWSGVYFTPMFLFILSSNRQLLLMKILTFPAPACSHYKPPARRLLETMYLILSNRG